MTANDERVPGHYQAGYIHWDLVVDTGMGYLEGCASKYVARWRKKGGRADLEKALHYVAKLREVAHRFPQPRPLSCPVSVIQTRVANFAAVNGLIGLERQVIEKLACWQYVQDVDALLNAMPEIIAQLVGDDGSTPPSALPDPEPVPLTEENMHAPRHPEPPEGEDGEGIPSGD